MSKRVDELRQLVDEKLRLQRYYSICEGLHYVSIFMAIFYVVTFKTEDASYLISWMFLALIGWMVTSNLEKKILQVKVEITSRLFENGPDN